MEVEWCDSADATTAEDSYWWSVDMSTEVTTLQSRLEPRVDRVEELFIAPWHTDLHTARDAILDHYDVWYESLAAEQQYLAASTPDSDDIFGGYLDVVFRYSDEIVATFETARDTFYQAEPPWIDDPDAIEAAFLDAGEVSLSCDSGDSA